MTSITTYETKTLKEIIERVDDVVPNAMPEAAKVDWISELDGLVAQEVMLLQNPHHFDYSRKYPDSLSWRVLIPYPYESVYECYVRAQIDFANGEYEKYNNSTEMFNAKMSGFRLWFLNTFKPAFPKIYERWDEQWTERHTR